MINFFKISVLIFAVIMVFDDRCAERNDIKSQEEMLMGFLAIGTGLHGKFGPVDTRYIENIFSHLTPSDEQSEEIDTFNDTSNAEIVFSLLPIKKLTPLKKSRSVKEQYCVFCHMKFSYWSRRNNKHKNAKTDCPFQRNIPVDKKI